MSLLLLFNAAVRLPVIEALPIDNATATARPPTRRTIIARPIRGGTAEAEPT